MKRKLIAAIFLELLALTAIFLLAARVATPAMTPVEALTETEATPAAPPPTTAPPTDPPATQPPDPVETLLAGLTVEQKVGQLFLVRCPETGTEAAVRELSLGGLLLFGRDFDGETPNSLREKLSRYQSAAALPLLLAVDEEGGTVTRVSSHSAFRASRFASPRELYARGGMEAVLAAEEEKAQLLSSLGINVNLAPVCDLSTQPGAFMYSRSLGQSPEITGQFVAGSIRTMDAWGVAAVMKHFPGYGNNADTHVGIATDGRTLEVLESADLQPFFDGIAAGGQAILVSHTIVTALDADAPASLSLPVHRYLRYDMGFEGVIVTDDLSMEAITDRYGAGEAAVLAVLAGNDLLCSTEYEIQYRAVLQACQTGRIPADLLDQAVMRVLRWKEAMGLLTAGTGNTAD